MFTKNYYLEKLGVFVGDLLPNKIVLDDDVLFDSLVDEVAKLRVQLAEERQKYQDEVLNKIEVALCVRELENEVVKLRREVSTNDKLVKRFYYDLKVLFPDHYHLVADDEDFVRKLIEKCFDV